MSEFCEHSKCEFNNRLEYCAIEAANPEEAVAVVLVELDAILYDEDHIAGDSYQLTSDDSETLLCRSFSYLQGDIKSFVWPLTEKTLSVRHRVDKKMGAESYAIEMGWRVHQQGATNDRFVVRYCIDTYAKGNVQAEIEAPDVLTGERFARPMTTYDYEQLYNELSALSKLHSAERTDNARVRLDSSI